MRLSPCILRRILILALSQTGFNALPRRPSEINAVLTKPELGFSRSSIDAESLAGIRRSLHVTIPRVGRVKCEASLRGKFLGAKAAPAAVDCKPPTSIERNPCQVASHGPSGRARVEKSVQHLRPTAAQRWLERLPLCVVALLIVFAWLPRDGRQRPVVASAHRAAHCRARNGAQDGLVHVQQSERPLDQPQLVVGAARDRNLADCRSSGADHRHELSRRRDLLRAACRSRACLRVVGGAARVAADPALCHSISRAAGIDRLLLSERDSSDLPSCTAAAEAALAAAGDPGSLGQLPRLLHPRNRGGGLFRDRVRGDGRCGIAEEANPASLPGALGSWCPQPVSGPALSIHMGSAP